MFYRVANLPIENVCIIKNFDEANFSDFKRLVVALKINPQKYNWPQNTCKLLKNKFPGSNWRVTLMRIKQSEVFDKVSVTEIGVFLNRRGAVTDFWFFWRVKKIFQVKNLHHVSRLNLGYLWEEYQKFWFFIMCQIFSIWLGFSGHSLLKPHWSKRWQFDSLRLNCWKLA